MDMKEFIEREIGLTVHDIFVFDGSCHPKDRQRKAYAVLNTTS